MARRLILDTCLIIAMERDARSLDGNVIADDDDVVIAAVTAAELLQGCELARPEVRERRETFVNGLLESIGVEDYTLDTARTHARLLAHTRRTGKPRGAHDLIIAATAAATGRSVVTSDAAACFSSLPGVDSIAVAVG